VGGGEPGACGACLAAGGMPAVCHVWQVDNSALAIDDGNIKQTVYLQNCSGKASRTVLQVKTSTPQHFRRRKNIAPAHTCLHR
jgi:hypothetical protein